MNFTDENYRIQPFPLEYRQLLAVSLIFLRSGVIAAIEWTSRYAGMSDPTNEIVEKVLAGDLDQYREIVRRFEEDVYRVAAPVLGCRSSAEDVTQEVFIVAYRRLDAFDREQPFRPWLLGIARNLVRNELRRRTREAARIEVYSRYIDAVTSERESEHSEVLSAALAICRDKLASAAAAAIHGRYDQGLGLEDLASRLQRSVTATRQLLYRAKISLRECIEAQIAAAGGDR